MRCQSCSYVYNHREAYRCPKCGAAPEDSRNAVQPDLLAATVKAPAKEPTRESWLEARRTHPCASEIAAILGMSQFRNATPWRVQHDKLEGRAEKPETSEEMEMGNLLEPFTGTLYTRKTTIPVKPWPKHTICVHRDGWGACTPDFIPVDPALPFDVDGKIVGEYNAWKWGEEFTDQIPIDYQLQGVWSMWVRDLEEWHVSAIIGMKHRIFVMKRDKGIEAETVDLVRQWWERHIECRHPVPVDGSDAASEYLSARFRTGRKVTLIATGEAEELMGVIRDAREWEARAEAAKNRIKEIMGEATLMTGSAGRCSWSAGGESKPKEVLDEQGYIRALEAAVPNPENIRSKFTETKTHPVSRRFQFTPAKE